jgi:hypothetical protein
MLLRDRPLLVSSVDADVYVARPQLESALLAAVKDERNLLLVGDAGSGKTTLLRKLEADIRDELTVAWIDGALPLTALDLLQQLGRALPPDRSPKALEIRIPAETSAAIRLLDAIDELPRNRRALVIVDEPVNETMTYDLFGRLRDRLWALPFTWIVAARPSQLGPLRAPPANAFWSDEIEVGPMGPEEIDQLLRRGLDESELHLVEQYPTKPLRDTPRRVVRWARAALRDDGQPADVGLLEREREVAALPRPGAMLLAEVEALDRPVAAGDEELLRRLGWSRTYAARWLASLERHGLLRAYNAPSERQGRPPKLYEVI